MNTLPVKRLLILLALAALLLAAPVFAAEEAPAQSAAAAAEEAPSGLSTLVLLLGLGAVTLVGAVAVLRENFRNIGGDSA